MTDYKIVNLINGGARIYEYPSGLSPKPPNKTWEIPADKFEELKQILYKMEDQSQVQGMSP